MPACTNSFLGINSLTTALLKSGHVLARFVDRTSLATGSKKSRGNNRDGIGPLPYRIGVRLFQFEIDAVRD